MRDFFSYRKTIEQLLVLCSRFGSTSQSSLYSGANPENSWISLGTPAKFLVKFLFFFEDYTKEPCSKIKQLPWGAIVPPTNRLC